MPIQPWTLSLVWQWAFTPMPVCSCWHKLGVWDRRCFDERHSTWVFSGSKVTWGACLSHPASSIKLDRCPFGRVAYLRTRNSENLNDQSCYFRFPDSSFTDVRWCGLGMPCAKWPPDLFLDHEKSGSGPVQAWWQGVVTTSVARSCRPRFGGWPDHQFNVWMLVPPGWGWNDWSW